MSSQALSILADTFNLLYYYHLASSTVTRKLELIETLGSVIKTINDRRAVGEKIAVDAETILTLELIRDIQIIINRDKKCQDDFKRTDELCQKLFGDKNESEVVEFLNHRIAQMRGDIDEALCEQNNFLFTM